MQVLVETIVPDPHIFGPPGSWFTLQGYGSGSIYHQAKIVRKTLIPTVLWLLLDFLSLKNDLNVPSISNNIKFVFALQLKASLCSSSCYKVKLIRNYRSVSFSLYSIAHIRGRYWSAQIDDISLWPLIISLPEAVQARIPQFDAMEGQDWGSSSR